MSKPIGIRVPSDDFELVIGGETYHPHEGEWVELLPVRMVGDAKALAHLNRFMADIAGLVLTEADLAELPEAEREAAADRAQRAVEDRTVAHFAELVGFVAPRIMRWTWTDLRGVPLPQPADDPAVYEQLSIDEVLWLVLACQGRNRAAEKNGSRPSPTTSSATARRTSRT